MYLYRMMTVVMTLGEYHLHQSLLPPLDVMTPNPQRHRHRNKVFSGGGGGH